MRPASRHLAAVVTATALAASACAGIRPGPIALDDRAEAGAGERVQVRVLDNDWLPDGATPQLRLDGEPAGVTLDEDGVLVWEAPAGGGERTVTYTLSTADGGTSTAEVLLVVRGDDTTAAAPTTDRRTAEPGDPREPDDDDPTDGGEPTAPGDQADPDDAPTDPDDPDDPTVPEEDPTLPGQPTAPDDEPTDPVDEPDPDQGGVDLLGPVVTMTVGPALPIDGAPAGTTVLDADDAWTASADVVDPGGVRIVEWLLDGDVVGTCEDAAARLASCDFSAPGGNPYGPATLVARAFDADGNVGTATRELLLDDGEGPSLDEVTIGPQPLSDDAPWTAFVEAADPGGVELVRVRVDGVVVGSCPGSPCALDGLAPRPAGDHDLVVEAFDRAGLRGWEERTETWYQPAAPDLAVSIGQTSPAVDDGSETTVPWRATVTNVGEAVAPGGEIVVLDRDGDVIFDDSFGALGPGESETFDDTRYAPSGSPGWWPEVARVTLDCGGPCDPGDADAGNDTDTMSVDTLPVFDVSLVEPYPGSDPYVLVAVDGLDDPDGGTPSAVLVGAPLDDTWTSGDFTFEDAGGGDLLLWGPLCVAIDLRVTDDEGNVVVEDVGSWDEDCTS